jgi:hypothetical protein
MKKYVIENRYGDMYSIDSENDKWYYNVNGSQFIRCSYAIDNHEFLEFIDPAGGPLISIDTSLKMYHPDLPDMIIDSIYYDQETLKYKLGVKNKNEETT